MDSVPLLYYLRYSILHVDYKLLQRVSYIYIFIYIKRICFCYMKKYGKKAFAGYKENCLLLSRAVNWMWKKTSVASLCEAAGNVCFSGVLSSSCSEQIPLPKR